MGRRGLPGNLVEPYRAGMIATASPFTGFQRIRKHGQMSNEARQAAAVQGDAGTRRRGDAAMGKCGDGYSDGLSPRRRVPASLFIAPV
jgi:hypothetical protein